MTAFLAAHERPSALDVDHIDTLTAAVAVALRREGAVRGVAGRYGKFNDAYYDEFARAILNGETP